MAAEANVAYMTSYVGRFGSMNLQGEHGSASANGHEPKCPPLINWKDLEATKGDMFMGRIDTDPPTRAAALLELARKFGVSGKSATKADRIHVGFLPGSQHYTRPERDLIARFSQRISTDGRVYVIGYSDQMEGELDEEEALMLAEARAHKAVTLLRDSIPNLEIAVKSSRHWYGDARKGKRVDIYWVRNY